MVRRAGKLQSKIAAGGIYVEAQRKQISRAQERGHASKIYIRSYYSFADFLKYFEKKLVAAIQYSIVFCRHVYSADHVTEITGNRT